MTAGDRHGSSDAETATTVELIRRARRGDARAFENLFGRFLQPLKRWAGGRLPRRARTLIDTDDLVQDTLMRTLQRLDVLEPRRAGGFQSYLRQAVINRIRDEVRRVERHPQTGLPEAGPVSDQPTPLEQTLGQDALRRYEAALGRLRPEDREAVLARLELGYRYDEIAEALGKPSRDAARMAISRALLRLAKELARER